PPPLPPRVMDHPRGDRSVHGRAASAIPPTPTLIVASTSGGAVFVGWQLKTCPRGQSWVGRETLARGGRRPSAGRRAETLEGEPARGPPCPPPGGPGVGPGPLP